MKRLKMKQLTTKIKYLGSIINKKVKLFPKGFSAKMVSIQHFK